MIDTIIAVISMLISAVTLSYFERIFCHQIYAYLKAKASHPNKVQMSEEAWKALHPVRTKPSFDASDTSLGTASDTSLETGSDTSSVSKSETSSNSSESQGVGSDEFYEVSDASHSSQ